MSVSNVAWLRRDLDYKIVKTKIDKEMRQFFHSLKVLFFVLWTSSLIFLPKGIESRAVYSTLYRDFDNPHQFDLLVEDMKHQSLQPDLMQSLLFDGKLDLRL